MISPNQFISQIFWPDTIDRQLDKHGFLIGWNLENFECCITNIVVLPFSKYEYVKTSLALAVQSKHLGLRSCSREGSATPVVLGEWIPSVTVDHVPLLQCQHENIWITLTSSSRSPLPLLHSLYSCGCRHKTSCHFVQYRPCLAENLSCLSNNPSGAVTRDTFSVNLSSKLDKSAYQYVISQINNANNIDLALRSQCTDILHNTIHLTPLLSPPPGASHDNEQTTCSRVMWSVALSLMILFSCLLLVVNGHVQRFLSYPLPMPSAVWTLIRPLVPLSQRYHHHPSSSHTSLSSVSTNTSRAMDDTDSERGRERGRSGWGGSGVWFRTLSLRDISITAAHLCERVSMLAGVVVNCRRFAGIPTPSSDIRLRQMRWIRVCSRLVCLVVDTALGAVCGCLLWRHRGWLLLEFHGIGHYIQDHFILGSLELLKHNPYGFKFNELLTNRLDWLLRSVLCSVGDIYLLIGPGVEHAAMLLLSFVGCLGLSIQLVLAIDIIRLLTIHIALVHKLLSSVHSGQVSTLVSLLYLFRGKKKNVLRKRIDTLDSTHRQLFSGIIIFSIIFFLFPTFAAYYFLFTVLQMGVVLCQALLWSVSIALKEFPFYEVYKARFDREFMSAGVFLTVQRTAGSVGAIISRRAVEHVGGKYPPAGGSLNVRRRSKRERRSPGGAALIAATTVNRSYTQTAIHVGEVEEGPGAGRHNKVQFAETVEVMQLSDGLSQSGISDAGSSDHTDPLKTAVRASEELDGVVGGSAGAEGAMDGEGGEERRDTIVLSGESAGACGSVTSDVEEDEGGGEWTSASSLFLNDCSGEHEHHRDLTHEGDDIFLSSDELTSPASPPPAAAVDPWMAGQGAGKGSNLMRRSVTASSDESADDVTRDRVASSRHFRSGEARPHSKSASGASLGLTVSIPPVIAPRCSKSRIGSVQYGARRHRFRPACNFEGGRRSSVRSTAASPYGADLSVSSTYDDANGSGSDPVSSRFQTTVSKLSSVEPSGNKTGGGSPRITNLRGNSSSSPTSSPTPSPRPVANHGASRSSSSRAYQDMTSNATYLVLHPRPPLLLRTVLGPYVPYLKYWCHRGAVVQLMYGAMYGHPALDLQMIRASVELSTGDACSLAPECDDYCYDDDDGDDDEGCIRPTEPLALPTPLVSGRGSSHAHVVLRQWDMRSCTGVWTTLVEIRDVVSSPSTRLRVYGAGASLDRALFFAMVFTFALCISLFGVALFLVFSVTLSPFDPLALQQNQFLSSATSDVAKAIMLQPHSAVSADLSSSSYDTTAIVTGATVALGYFQTALSGGTYEG